MEELREQLNGILFDMFRLVNKVPKSIHCSPHLVLCQMVIKFGTGWL